MTINYFLKRIKDKSNNVILHFILELVTNLEDSIKKVKNFLDKIIDDSYTKVTMPPIEIVTKGVTAELNVKKLHIIGNSHAHTFTGSELGAYARGNFQKTFWDSYSLGPLSSVDLETTKYTLLTKLIEKYEFKKNDYVLLPLGEAECRWYALKDTVLPVDVSEEQLSLMLKPFLDAAMRVNINLMKLGIKPIIWGGHASSRLGPRADKDIPIVGESKIRNRLSLIWEKEMRNFAEKNNFPFISILTLMLDENLETRESFLVDACHLKTELLEGFLLAELRNLSISVVEEKQL